MILPPLFNPSNDMALAANLRQYTPPRHIQQMESQLASLALLWDEGPWGWSLATKQRYLHMGIPESQLPSDAWLARHRRLSSRQFAVEYYKKMEEDMPDERLLPCQARVATQPLPCFSYPFILKSLWSSSGRGNVVARGEMDVPTLRRVRKVIQEQGGIVVEPFYADKALDFAMEFWADGSATRFLGYSVFSADETGHYGGNYVEGQDEFLQRISLPDDLLKKLTEYHCHQLSPLPYRGPVGIDMMRLTDGRIHPCVEINFRRTMGLLALDLYEKGMTSDQLLAGDAYHGFSAQVTEGRLSITFRP